MDFSEAGIHNWPLFPCLIITVLKHCKDRGFISHPVQCWGCQGCYSKLIRQLPSQNQAPPSRDIKHGYSKDASAPNQIFIIEYRVHSVHSVHYHFLMSWFLLSGFGPPLNIRITWLTLCCLVLFFSSKKHVLRTRQSSSPFFVCLLESQIRFLQSHL